MTELLRHAFDRASELPESQQIEFARFLLAELESEQRCDELLSLPESNDLQDRLADDALDAHKASPTRPLDPALTTKWLAARQSRGCELIPQ